ncbi:xanthine dehydrogenase family protein molybdopterin-binding subunit [Mesorhizobium sp. BE184]|uniref:xanthine dehydrogenase family protein molybdopterin-binding subunit n=1 Tax=Mesorhizobium sp. BE184 TaxID=2817714 RepID=UPI002863C2CD|nr:xanthine dehydrogenase family protein molybdopterin-binding subunit [Mesorhizobium sp. BE184]MDR7034619.1 carbon-monoxide dehydrogenase large subunit [Mesorhizobium sp. BE184]
MNLDASKFGIGQPVQRVEDPRFMTGRGKYVADITLGRQAYAAFVYSPHAHADIKSVDVSAARDLPGVIDVLTGADWQADGLGAIEPETMPEDMGGPKGYRTRRWPLAFDRVRYVGERVAVVIATTEAVARDAAELIEVNYDILPAVISAADAVKADAPQLYEGAPGNTSFRLMMGNSGEIEKAFAAAHHITRLELFNNRVNAFAMEPRGCIGDYDEGNGRYTLYTSTQNVHGLRQTLSMRILRVPQGKIRVVARDVGGGFGMKTQVYPEDAAVVWAARKLGRPVKWVATRSEALMGDNHGRDQTVTAELALAADGKFLGLRWSALNNVGAYIEGAGVVPLIMALKLGQTVYDIPAVSVSTSAVFTNTAPTVPYRGAGRPEAVYTIERIVEQAAREMGMDPVELRAKNLITKSAMPYSSKTGWTYDSGDFITALEKCQKNADWDGYEARRAKSQGVGKLRGRGLTYYIDNTGMFNDRMEIKFDPSGTLSVVSGLVSHGQGHETAFAQMVSEWLNVPLESVRLVQADTDEVLVGRGTYGSRSMIVGGSALKVAAEDVIERGKKFVAHFMEASAGDIVFEEGQFSVAGTDKTMSIVQVAQRSYMPFGLPNELGVGLHGSGTFSADVPSFPNGCHICEVEIDPETGVVALDRYTVVDDIGFIINPLTSAGQIHGGIVQGVGQALMEDIVYDESGQFVTGSLMDYAVPRADIMPDIGVDFSLVPSSTNLLGVKGVGEGGTVAATPTVINAVLDALAPVGVTDIAMPATPLRVWEAIQAAGPRTA